MQCFKGKDGGKCCNVLAGERVALCALMHDVLLSIDPGWSAFCCFALSISICTHRGVMAWRKWLAEKGGSGPGYDNGEQGEAYRANSGRLHRRALLDRYSQHTVNCKACSQASFLLTFATP